MGGSTSSNLPWLGPSATAASNRNSGSALLDGGNMEIVSTVDDARMYAKPWSFTTYPKRLHGEILEYIRNENEADARHLVGK